jgi:adenylate kinase
MKRLQRDLESVIKNLKALTQKTQKMSKELAKLEKAAAKPKPKAKRRPAKKAARKKVARKKVARKKAPARKKVAVRKRKKITATDTILNIVKRSKKGVNTATLKKKTSYNDAKVRSIVFRLKKAGKIKAPTKGLYVKA